jgi:hypothetical protein
MQQGETARADDESLHVTARHVVQRWVLGLKQSILEYALGFANEHPANPPNKIAYDLQRKCFWGMPYRSA